MKEILKKSIAVIAAVTVVAGLCSSCGNKQTDKTEDGKTIVRVGSWPNKEGPNLDNAVKNEAMFEGNNPDIEIEPDTWTFDLRTFYPKAEAGLLPTLYNSHFTEMGLINDGGYAKDITSILEEKGFLDLYREDVLKIASNEEGRVTALPHGCYILGLAVNTDLMKQAGLVAEDGTPYQPTDWYDLAETAVKIKEATGKPGFVFPTANNNGGWIFTPVAWSFGVDFMEQDADGKWKATFNTPEAVEALQYIKDLKWKYDVLPENTLIDGDEYYKIFGSGQAGIQITAGDVPGKLVKYGMKPDQFGMIALPAGPKRHVTLLGGSLWCINDQATDEQAVAAVKWMEETQGHSPNLTEERKKTLEDNMVSGIEANPDKLIGIKSMSVWGVDSDYAKYNYELIDKYCNTNPNGVKLYNDFVINTPCDIQPEEPICAQDLYGVLDNCIQEVLGNENADCAKLIEDACNDFQTNFLDRFAY